MEANVCLCTKQSEFGGRQISFLGSRFGPASFPERSINCLMTAMGQSAVGWGVAQLCRAGRGLDQPATLAHGLAIGLGT